ncbi:hypothetical protein L3X38_033483 [Prunus dulcis]|uniref:Retrotransposon Copia-like N-terminal domain-containing protein n=1 Tax=Prunus dulcis TaxID=3755 RepID=A0AAD4VG09_PRUDU|nr:hypothetical protein L3X38_033483 [Prunus dulcis]
MEEFSFTRAAIIATAATPSSITMPNVDAFISSHASGFTSPTASPTSIVMVHTESSTNLLLGFKLNGSNYAIWASMIKLYATSKGKLDYLTRDSNAPDSKDPQFGKWKIDDVTMKSWMMRIMKPSLLNMFHTYLLPSKRVSVFSLTYCRAHRVSVFCFYVFLYVPYLLGFVSCFTRGL